MADNNNDERDTSKLSLDNNDNASNDTSTDDDISTELKSQFDELISSKRDGDDQTLIEKPEKIEETEEPEKIEEPKKEEKIEEPEKEQPEVAKTDTIDYKTEHEKTLKEFQELKKRHEALEKTVATIKPKEEVKDAIAAIVQSDIKAPEIKEAKINIPPIDSDKLARFLSGDPEQATPILTEFVHTIIGAVGEYIVQKSNNDRELANYAETANKRFYEQYEDLNDYRELTSQAYSVVIAKNPGKWPHECFEEVANLARKTIDYIAQKKGAVQPVTTSDNEIKTVHRTVATKGGASTVGVRPASTTSANNTLTEQQKEMFELIDPELDHKIQ